MNSMAFSLPKISPFSPIFRLKTLIIVTIISFALVFVSGTDRGSVGNGGDELYREILRDETVERIKELGKISDADGFLERTFLSPASIRAIELIQSWMMDAGLKTWVDQMGNVHGRFEAANSTAETLLIGSHLDTVIDAGMYDGSMGVVCAISALKVFKLNGMLGELQRPVEVIAFSDEEGVRFQTTFLGSAAVAGILSGSALQISDKSGIKMQEVLRENSLDATEESLLQVKYEPKSVWGYVEVHIEQGPVLESIGCPLGIVQGIAGQTRLKVTVKGSQGHAGTVPMFMRQDPMVASAELIVLLESLCKHPESFLAYDDQCGGFTRESLAGLVCTVGEISCWPSASNVNFTVDIRAMDDTVREAIIFEFSKRLDKICDNRMVNCSTENKHTAKAANCDSELSLQLKHAAHSALKKMTVDLQGDVPLLMSGAGHDAIAMSHLTKVGMIFVRCRGGVSHSPEEYVLDDDIWATGLALLQFLETST
ncbi:putative allantoate deiminase [Iris pallida]|uniref:allantoate deiminase n=1 Tax=Iris pallida TaxID=29817 RepID=A0AAX6EMC8_IRIPA|nr:putative allantoate deiminase [Iris pallida]